MILLPCLDIIWDNLMCSQATISAIWPQNKPSLILFEVRPVFLIDMLNIISLFGWLVFSFDCKTKRDLHSDKSPLIFMYWIHNLLLTKNSLILCQQCMECTSSPCPYVILIVKTKSNHIQGAMMSPRTNWPPICILHGKTSSHKEDISWKCHPRD